MTAERDRSAPASPCINVCAVDPSGDHCLGCFRSLAEIAAWSALSAQRRREVLDAAERRMAAAFGDDAALP